MAVCGVAVWLFICADSPCFGVACVCLNASACVCVRARSFTDKHTHTRAPWPALSKASAVMFLLWPRTMREGVAMFAASRYTSSPRSERAMIVLPVHTTPT